MANPDEPRNMTRRLLAEATSREKTVDALVAGLRLAAQRLDAALSPILGSLATRMIMASALRETAAHHPFTSGISVHEDGMDADIVLSRKAAGDYDEVRWGFEDLLEAFVKLLKQLVGRELAATLVRRTADRESEE